MTFRILLNLNSWILSMTIFSLWNLVSFSSNQWTMLAIIYSFTSTIVLLNSRTTSTMIWLSITTISAQSKSRRTSTTTLQLILITCLISEQLMTWHHSLRTSHQLTLSVQLRSQTSIIRQIDLSVSSVSKSLIVLRIFSVMRRSTRLMKEDMTVRWRIVYLWEKEISIDVINYWVICEIDMSWWTRRDSARWEESHEWSTEESFEECDYFHTRSSQHSI